MTTTKPKRSVVLEQHTKWSNNVRIIEYKVVKVVNYTELEIGLYIDRTQTNNLIQRGFQVTIKPIA